MHSLAAAGVRAKEGRVVGVGSVVTIECDDQLESWTVGPEGESNIDAGILGAHTPLVRALLGAAVGETRSYAVGQRVWQVSVVAISRPT